MFKNMKTLFSQNLKGKVSDIQILHERYEKCGKLMFNIGDNKITISDYHDQDCCESVFCNFEDFSDNYKKQIDGIEIDKFEIKVEEDETKREGIVLCFSENPLHKVFLGCHDEQNGCYSNDLELIVNINDKITKIDISDCTVFVEK